MACGTDCCTAVSGALGTIPKVISAPASAAATSVSAAPAAVSTGSGGSDAALAGEISQLRQPTLILWGSEDRLIPPEHGQGFNKDIAGSQLQVFEGLGHVPHEEDPEATVQAVKSFLNLPP